MTSSGNSSAPSHASKAAPSRKRIALTGRSRPTDPRTTAARADLADIRLADQLFAPHYAAPLPRIVAQAAELEARRNGDPVGEVPAGSRFEVLEITNTHVWGVTEDGRVGYLPLAALAA